MLTPEQAQGFAAAWVLAWNSKDLDEVLTHYAPHVEFNSPFVARLGLDPYGTIRGRDALRPYFRRAFEKFPALRFDLLHTAVGTNSLVLIYRSVESLTAAEYMELNDHNLAVRVRCHYW